MGRTFDLPAAGRRYSVRVTSIDEGWELWIYEGRRPLALGGIVGMDAALEAWRAGDDAVVRMVERIRADIASGKLSTSLPRSAREAGGVAACEDRLQSPPAVGRRRPGTKKNSGALQAPLPVFDRCRPSG